MPLGPAANVLIGSETEATGTPLFKGPQATIALASSVQEKRQDV
jgi:formylmethanofuran dehydrogenase subunit D